MTTIIETISPETAKQYLEHNKNNRPIKKAHVTALANEMLSGRFSTTHQGIAFDVSGNLVDGQHRLAAVVESGCTVKMLVTRGLENVEHVDIGDKRNFNDVMRISGMAADDVILRNGCAPQAISKLYRLNNVFGSVTIDEMVYLYKILKEESRILYDAAISGKKKGIYSSEVGAAVMAALLCGVSEEAIKAFFAVYYRQEIVDGYNCAVVLNLYSRRMEMMAARQSLSRPALYLLTQNTIWNFVNNTSAKKATITDNPRYEVRAKLVHIAQYGVKP